MNYILDEFWNFKKNNQKQVVTFQSDDVISLKTSRADRSWNFKSAKKLNDLKKKIISKNKI